MLRDGVRVGARVLGWIAALSAGFWLFVGFTEDEPAGGVLLAVVSAVLAAGLLLLARRLGRPGAEHQRADQRPGLVAGLAPAYRFERGHRAPARALPA